MVNLHEEWVKVLTGGPFPPYIVSNDASPLYFTPYNVLDDLVLDQLVDDSERVEKWKAVSKCNEKIQFYRDKILHRRSE